MEGEPSPEALIVNVNPADDDDHPIKKTNLACYASLAVSLTSRLHRDQVRVAGLDEPRQRRRRSAVVDPRGRRDGAGQRGDLARDAVVDALLQRDVSLPREAHPASFRPALKESNSSDMAAE